MDIPSPGSPQVGVSIPPTLPRCSVAWGRIPNSSMPRGPRRAGVALSHQRALISSQGILQPPRTVTPSPRARELRCAQPLPLSHSETCAGGGSPWLRDLGSQRSTGNGRWISRQTGLSINSLRGRPATAGAAQSQGWALQLFITFFCSRFLSGSAAQGSSSPACKLGMSSVLSVGLLPFPTKMLLLEQYQGRHHPMGPVPCSARVQSARILSSHSQT